LSEVAAKVTEVRREARRKETSLIEFIGGSFVEWFVFRETILAIA
jgi:hypothetical protein